MLPLPPPGKQLFFEAQNRFAKHRRTPGACVPAMAVAFRLRSRPGISDWSPEQAGKLGGWKGPNLIRFFHSCFSFNNSPTPDGSQLPVWQPHYKSTVSITFREG